MKSILMFLLILTAHNAFAQELRFRCKKIGAVPGHPIEMNVYLKSNDLKFAQIKFDAVPGDGYSQVDLLGDILETNEDSISYTHFTTYNPMTHQRIGAPNSDVLLIESTLIEEGERFEGVDGNGVRSPRGHVLWTSSQTQTKYSCAMSVRD